jgi:hypothetical protein
VTVEELAQAYRDADQEYQFAIASGNLERLRAAKMAKKTAFSEYKKAKIEQIKQQYEDQTIYPK